MFLGKLSICRGVAPLVAVAVLAIAASPALAQKTLPQGILGVAKNSSERLRPKKLFLLQLMMSPIVQEEITLSEEQTSAFDELRTRLGGKMQELQKRMISSRRERDQEKRQDILEKANVEFESIFREGDELLEEILVPDQLSRLKGIYLQKAGPKAVMQEWVEDELEITDSQRKKMEQILETTEKEIKEEVAKLAEQQKRGKIRELIVRRNMKLGDDLTNVLTDDQRKKYDKLSGATVHLR